MNGIDILKIVGMVLLALLIIPMLAAGLISVLTTRANTKLLSRFGERTPLILGWFGVIVHELSHALMAIIFRHQIDQIKLLQNPFSKDHNGRLGYVSHAWDPTSRYQTIGNFFIGMAPIFGVSLVMWLITKLLWPTIFELNQLGWRVLLTGSWWQILIWLYLVVNLTLALNMSDADWQNTRSGMLLYCLVLLVVGVILGIVNLSIAGLYTQLVMPILIFYGTLLVVSSIMYLIATLLTRN